jgi:hypothetical protein
MITIRPMPKIPSVVQPLETIEKFDKLTAIKAPCPVKEKNQPPLSPQEIITILERNIECIRMPDFKHQMATEM